MQGLDVATRSEYISKALHLPKELVFLVKEYGALDIQYDVIHLPFHHKLLGVIDGHIYTNFVTDVSFRFCEDGFDTRMLSNLPVKSVERIKTNILLLRCRDDLLVEYDRMKKTWWLPFVKDVFIYEEELYSTSIMKIGIQHWDVSGTEETQLFAEHGLCTFQKNGDQVYITDQNSRTYRFYPDHLQEVNECENMYMWNNNLYDIGPDGIFYKEDWIVGFTDTISFHVFDYIVFYQLEHCRKCIVDLRNHLVTTFQDPNVYLVFQNRFYVI